MPLSDKDFDGKARHFSKAVSKLLVGMDHETAALLLLQMLPVLWVVAFDDADEALEQWKMKSAAVENLIRIAFEDEHTDH